MKKITLLFMTIWSLLCIPGCGSGCSWCFRNKNKEKQQRKKAQSIQNKDAKTNRNTAS